MKTNKDDIGKPAKPLNQPSMQEILKNQATATEPEPVTTPQEHSLVLVPAPHPTEARANNGTGDDGRNCDDDSKCNGHKDRKILSDSEEEETIVTAIGEALASGTSRDQDETVATDTGKPAEPPNAATDGVTTTASEVPPSESMEAAAKAATATAATATSDPEAKVPTQGADGADAGVELQTFVEDTALDPDPAPPPAQDPEVDAQAEAGIFGPAAPAPSSSSSSVKVTTPTPTPCFGFGNLFGEEEKDKDNETLERNSVSPKANSLGPVETGMRAEAETFLDSQSMFLPPGEDCNQIPDARQIQGQPAEHVGGPSEATHSVAKSSRQGGVVHSLEDSMGFWDHCLDELESQGSLMDLVNALETDSVSTSFSGIDAPRVAVNCLHHSLEQRLSTKLPKTHNLFHIEWDGEAQAELAMFDADVPLEERPCCFSNISDFWQADLKDVIEQLKEKPTMAVEILAQRISDGTATCRVAYCKIHKRLCALKVAKRHISGTSCTAHSKRGAGLSLADPGVVHLLAWISLRILLQEPCIIQENVKGFPCDILKRFLLRLYWIDVVVLDSCFFGVPQARD